MNEDANLLSVGAVDFGIIVDSAVILVENVFRNFQARPEQRQALLQNLAEERWGPDPTKTGAAGGGHASAWTDRMRLILISAMEVDTAVFFSAAITVAAFVPLFTMQGVEGQIFNPMARTYGFALAGALFATFTITPVLASILLARAHRGDRDDRGAGAAPHLLPCPALLAHPPQADGRVRDRLPRLHGPAGPAARNGIPAGARGRQSVDPGVDAAHHLARGGDAVGHQDARDPAVAIPRSSPWSRSTAVRTTAATPPASTTPSSSFP